MYKECGLKATIDTEIMVPGPEPLYTGTLKAYDKNGNKITLSEEKKRIIIERVQSRLKIFGIDYEIDDQDPSNVKREAPIIHKRDSISDVRSLPKEGK
jgi:hypothetical protein